jgi:hypothetical protein
MLDQYQEEYNAFSRLRDEYDVHKSLIVAVDFDDTIYDFHGKGYDYSNVIHTVRECNNLGFKVVIFTANKDHDLVLKRCKEIGIEIEGINKQLLPQFEGSGKIYYNVLLDDRAGLCSSMRILNSVIQYAKENGNG